MSSAINREDVDNWIVFGSVNTFRYTNHAGDTALRVVIPHALRYGQSPHHKEDQWLLEVYDVEKQALRTYALNSIHPR